MQRKEAGFAHLAIAFIILVALIGAAGFFVYNRNKSETSLTQTLTNETSTSSEQGDDCTEAKAGGFTDYLTDLDLVTTIQNPIM